ncbi:hypothetical protein OMO38_17065 [Chryseobacterium sp. 09-1422]|uniref:DUF4625 domain-containing protein n=1 Tax=Chryseobacterium kimseyorum TaxID=2984028 RepID=A0ABT3I2F2_9FLAO|nr:hypothetical protein [Chryseobacterium kimseyorum]MCW3170241.1 hypothetical protein [Chryseobacterium kimseyorum]
MLKIFQLFLTLIIFSIVIISCNPVGETVSEEKPLDDQLVNTTENIDLKKGDVLVIWGKMDASFLENNNVPSFRLNYNLSLNGKTIENSTVTMFAVNYKIINSTHEVRKEEKEEEEQTENETSDDENNSEETPEEKPEKIVKSDWTFEQEVIQIPIEKDGKYTLDYKASSDSESARSMFTKVAVILRKK